MKHTGELICGCSELARACWARARFTDRERARYRAVLWWSDTEVNRYFGRWWQTTLLHTVGLCCTYVRPPGFTHVMSSGGAEWHHYDSAFFAARLLPPPCQSEQAMMIHSRAAGNDKLQRARQKTPENVRHFCHKHKVVIFFANVFPRYHTAPVSCILKAKWKLKTITWTNLHTCFMFNATFGNMDFFLFTF